jgi:glycosyltransferase involved in cell wall biosynthesis
VKFRTRRRLRTFARLPSHPPAPGSYAISPDRMRRDVVAVIPAYQCAATIGSVVAGVLRHLAEVVVVDDGSDDATGEIAAAAGAVVERLPQNCGKGVALLRGIEVALERSPEAVLLLDGDGQHDPEDIPGFLAAWDAGAGDLLVGTRMGDPDTIPRSRYWTNRIGSRALSWMTGWRIEDSQSGYRLVGADLLRRLPLSARGYGVESEMLIKASHRRGRLGEVPIRTIYEGGPSHFRPVLDTVRIALSCAYWKAFDGG